jgi:hypothetical protein
MIAVLLVAGLATVEVPQVNASPAQDGAETRCRAAVTEKVNGTITSFAVTKSTRIGATSLLRGTITVERRPVASPGKMLPAHIAVYRFSYQCRLSPHRKPQVTVLAGNN